MSIKTVNIEDLMALGLKQGTAQKILRLGKEEMVRKGFTIYSNRSIQILPVKIVNDLLGFDIISEIEK